MLILRIHAIKEMKKRKILFRQVEHVVNFGETIEEYPDDETYPSRLMFGLCEERPMHVGGCQSSKRPGPYVYNYCIRAGQNEMGRNLPKKIKKPIACISCKYGVLLHGQTTFAVDEDGVLVVIRKVPALICDTCGEDYLDDIVTQRLEAEVDDALVTDEKVIIQDFRAA